MFLAIVGRIFSKYIKFSSQLLKICNEVGTVRFSTQRKLVNGHRKDHNHPNQNDFTKQPDLKSFNHWNLRSLFVFFVEKS